jgi:type I restriction enzyme S subunit
MKSRWEKKRLGEVLEVQNGFAFDSKRFNASNGPPLIRIRSLKSGVETETHYDGAYDERYIVQSGDLLIGMDGEFGCYEWKGAPSLLNQRVCRLQGFSDELLPRFLFYGVNDYLKAIEDVTGFATVKHLSSKQILDIEFPLPPLAEQRRIVGILDEAFAGLATAQAHAEKNLQNARALFESHLNEVFTKKGEGWVDRKLNDLCREITVGYVGPMAKEYTASGVTFLRSQNIRPFQVSLDNALFISREFDNKIAKSRLCPGDVAVVRTGYPGTAAVIPPSLPEANCADLVIVRPGKEVVPQYLAAFFNSTYGKQHVSGKLVGAAQKHFNVGAAKETVVHVPPLQEQRTAIARLDALSGETRRLAAIYERKLATLGELKKSLLHQAFAGEL